jgi:hypothetical protein
VALTEEIDRESGDGTGDVVRLPGAWAKTPVGNRALMQTDAMMFCM